MKPTLALRSFLLGSSLLAAVTSAHAATYYWDGATASWNTNTNWSTDSAATTPDPVTVPGALDDLIFNITTVNGAESITLDANQAAKSLTFNNTGTTTLLGGGTARTLTLGTGGVTMDAAAGAVTLGDGTAGNNVLLSLSSGAQTWTNNSASNFTFNNSSASFSRSTGATLTFNKLGAGNFAVTSGVSNDATGIIGPWAFYGTTGTQYATVSGGNIVGYTGTTQNTESNWTDAAANYEITSTGTKTLSGNRTGNTFRYSGAGNGAIALGTVSNTLTTNGILAVGSSGTLTISGTGTTSVIAGSTGEIVIGGTQAVTISAAISSGAITKTGDGTLLLSNNSNSYTGITYINAGAITASVVNALGTTAGGTIVSSGAALQISANNSTYAAEALTLNGTGISGGGALRKTSGGGSTTWAGLITLASDSRINSDVGTLNLNVASGNAIEGTNKNITFGGAGNIVVSDAISIGSGSITKDGVGTIQLSAANSFTGALNINGGTVELRAVGALADNAVVFGAGSTGTLSVRNNNAVISNLNTDPITPGAAVITNGSIAGGTLTVGNAQNLSGTFAGTIIDGAAGTLGLTKAGTGTLTLSGTNGYTGATNITKGTLIINGDQSTANGAVTVAAGTVADTPVAKLGGTGTIGGNVSLTAESALDDKNGGVLAPTAAASGTALDVTGTTTFNAGSIFEWNLNAATSNTGTTNQGNYGQLAGTGTISGSDAVFKIVLGSNDFTDDFWNFSKTWDNVITGTGAITNLADIFGFDASGGLDATGLVTGQGQFTFSGTSTLNWTPVLIPEPTSALAGLLLTAGLLRRRRR